MTTSWTSTSNHRERRGVGNPDTLILNSLVYGNGGHGIMTVDDRGGPHYIVNTTIHGNAWNGVSVTRNHEVFLVNNTITGNGTAPGTMGGRAGVTREAVTPPNPAGIHLLNNLVCGNRLGEITGPALDETDGQEAFYEMVRTDDGLTKSFEVRFTLDEDGIWRLRMF
jgi:hypothetical protein